MSKIDYSVFRHINVFTDLNINLHIGDEKKVKNVVSSQLENYGITTLEQLFKAYDNGLFNDLRKSGHRTIKGIIELLKFQYLNEPLVADEILDSKAVCLGRVLVSNKDEGSLLRLGFTQDEIMELLSTTGLSEDATFLDVFQAYLSKVDLPKQEKDKTDIVVSNLFHKISLILEYKQKEAELVTGSDSDLRIIEQLRHQILVLTERRNSIDGHINELTQILNSLETKGKGK